MLSIDTLIMTERTKLYANTGKYIGVSGDVYKLHDVTILTFEKKHIIVNQYIFRFGQNLKAFDLDICLKSLI